jgi:nitroreductase
MKEGIFSYSLDSHSVTTLRHGNFADEVVKVMQGMQTARTASLTIFLCANFPKAMKIFPHSSGLRDLYVDAGRIIQGLILAAGAAGLGCLPTPALSDKPSEDLLDLRTPREAAVYSCTVGVLKS